MMVNFDCSAMWMKDCYLVSDAFNVDPLYLKHKHDEEVIDFRVSFCSQGWQQKWQGNITASINRYGLHYG